MALVVDRRTAGVPADFAAGDGDEGRLGAGEGVVDGEWREVALFGGFGRCAPWRLGGCRHCAKGRDSK